MYSTHRYGLVHELDCKGEVPNQIFVCQLEQMVADGDVKPFTDPEYPKRRYWAANTGVLYSKKNCIVIPMKQQKDRYGYYKQHLRRTDGLMKTFLVHRIVYECFYGKIKPGYEIDHIDGDRINNDVTNLEQVTPEENQRRSSRAPIAVLGRREGESEWTKFKSLTNAAGISGCHRGKFHKVLNGKQKTISSKKNNTKWEFLPYRVSELAKI